MDASLDEMYAKTNTPITPHLVAVPGSPCHALPVDDEDSAGSQPLTSNTSPFPSGSRSISPADADEPDMAGPTMTSNNSPSPSDSSSTPTSPTNMNPLTPGRQASPGVDQDIVVVHPVTAVNTYDSPEQEEFPEEEFPNPYDFPPLPLPRPRVQSTPQLLDRNLLLPPQRLPSILRPSHPKSFNSLGSKRATLSLSGIDFDIPPLPALEDRRLSMHSSSSMYMDDGPLRPYSVTPEQPPRSSLSMIAVPSPPPLRPPSRPYSVAPWQPHHLSRSMSDFTASFPPSEYPQYCEEEPRIEISERIEDEPLPDSRPAEIHSVEHQVTRKPSEVGPATKAQELKTVRKVPRWKFWARGSGKMTKAG